jgi:hypothetical protein
LPTRIACGAIHAHNAQHDGVGPVERIAVTTAQRPPLERVARPHAPTP